MTGSRSNLQADEGHFRVTKWTVDPGGVIPMHRHEYPYVVVPLVTATMEVTDADQKHSTTEMQAGESYTRPVGTQHEIRNPSTENTITFVEVELVR